MRLGTSNENVSSLYGLLAIPLVALTAFVVGYTVSRAHLSQSQSGEVAPKDYNLVIPHQGQMWSDFGS